MICLHSYFDSLLGFWSDLSATWSQAWRVRPGTCWKFPAITENLEVRLLGSGTVVDGDWMRNCIWNGRSALRPSDVSPLTSCASWITCTCSMEKRISRYECRISTGLSAQCSQRVLKAKTLVPTIHSIAIRGLP